MVNGHCVVTKTKLRKINTCIELLNRMTNSWEVYVEPAYKAFDKRWGFNNKGSFLVKHPTMPRRFYTNRDVFRDALSPKLRKRYDKEYKELILKEDIMYKQDMELFCKIFKKHVRSWWD